MEMKMNKTGFIKALEKELSYSKEQCLLINEVLENNFFLSKKNKNKIIEEFIQKLDIDEEEATSLYETTMEIVKNEIKNKLKKPFKSID